jgi:hypothetical protein
MIPKPPIGVAFRKYTPVLLLNKPMLKSHALIISALAAIEANALDALD